MTTDERTGPTAATGHARHRDPRIDALRGIALMGILIVNLPFFAMPYGFAGNGWKSHDVAYLGTLTAFLIQALFENKFILIFAFLFGMGAVGQIESSGPRRFIMRMIVLAGLGVLNAAFVFEADILLPYAVLGLLLMPVISLTTRSVLILAALLWAVAILDHALAGIYLATATVSPDLTVDARIVLFRDGGFLAIAGQRIADWVSFSRIAIPSLWPMTASAFCLGIAAYRGRDLVFAPESPWLMSAARLLFWPALLGNGVYAALCLAPADWAGGHVFLVGFVLRPVFAPLLTVVIVAGLMRLLSMPQGRGLRDFFAPSGRMSLSIYMLQGLTGSLLFFGYGAGLFAHLRLQAVFVLSLVLFLALAALAAAWSACFGAGPLERLMARILAAVAQPRRSTPSKGRPGPQVGSMPG